MTVDIGRLWDLDQSRDVQQIMLIQGQIQRASSEQLQQIEAVFAGYLPSSFGYIDIERALSARNYNNELWRTVMKKKMEAIDAEIRFYKHLKYFVLIGCFIFFVLFFERLKLGESKDIIITYQPKNGTDLSADDYGNGNISTIVVKTCIQSFSTESIVFGASIVGAVLMVLFWAFGLCGIFGLNGEVGYEHSALIKQKNNILAGLMIEQ